MQIKLRERGHAMSMMKMFTVGVVTALLTLPAQAEICGPSPDLWEVTGIPSNDTLNVRMGPGANYPVIASFDYDEKGLHQVACVPYTQHYIELTEAQIAAMPSSWCLMQTPSKSKSGWVAQRYITSTGDEASYNDAVPYASIGFSDSSMISKAQDMIYAIFDQQFFADSGGAASAMDLPWSGLYFSDEIVAWLASENNGPHPLYGVTDFDGTITESVPDLERSFCDGVIKLNIDVTNKGKTHRADFYLRANNNKPGAPLQIIRVDHSSWSYP